MSFDEHAPRIRAGNSTSNVLTDPASWCVLPESAAPFDEYPDYSLSMYSGLSEAGAINNLFVQSALEAPKANFSVKIDVGPRDAHSRPLPHSSGSLSTQYGQGDNTPSGTLIGSGYLNHENSEKVTEKMP